ncbi:MAG: restriction endonuclease subunit S, partial [Chloroflexota bacterium]
EAWQGKLDPEWFAAQYQCLFFELVTSKSDNRIFSTEWLDRIRIEVPDFETVQLPQREKKRALSGLCSKINQVRNKATEILSHHLNEEDFVPIFSGNIVDIFDVHGGNSGLTEELIYHNQPLTPQDSVVVLSGATQAGNKMGEIARNTVLSSGKKLKTMNKESILLTRNGFYAGTMTYVNGIEFATNDHAYVLTPKPSWAKRINLQWFTHQYAGTVRGCVSSRSDNATFNKEWLAKLPVRVPDRLVQDALAQKFSALQTITENLEDVEKEITRLLELSKL